MVLRFPLLRSDGALRGRPAVAHSVARLLSLLQGTWPWPAHRSGSAPASHQQPRETVEFRNLKRLGAPFRRNPGPRQQRLAAKLP